MNIAPKDLVDELNELLNPAERVEQEAGEKVDDLTTIRDGLNNKNTSLGDAISALEGIKDITDEVEGFLNDAEEFDIT